jgi:insertion element IS1 protein InsB
VISGRLEVEVDERWSFVQKKAHKPWVWRAIDTQTCPIMALHVGDRRRGRAKPLWANVLAASRVQTTLYPDQYDVCGGVIPAAQPKAITQQTWETNYSARFNNTIRQRVSRLVRDTLAFAKKRAHQPIEGVDGLVGLVAALKPHQRVTVLALDHRSGETGSVQAVLR